MLDNSGICRSSSYCGSGSCVEVALAQGDVKLRDSKDPSRAAHIFTRSEWAHFLKAAKAGEFDIAG